MMLFLMQSREVQGEQRHPGFRTPKTSKKPIAFKEKIQSVIGIFFYWHGEITGDCLGHLSADEKQRHLDENHSVSLLVLPRMG